MPITLPSAAVRAGTVAHFAAATPPTGWLACTGAAVSRSLYGALFLAIGTTYGAGDGSTTFNLPDLRGEFIRGHDGGRGVDTGRNLGSAQAHQMQSHTHTLGVFTGADGTQNRVSAGPVATQTVTETTSATGGTSNGSENRPRNVAMLPCIKF